MENRKTILVFGAFDIENYGDLLFPLIARRRMSHYANVHFVSPAGNDELWADCIKPMTTNDAIQSTAGIDGVLIGGGNVIHGPTPDMAPYNQYTATLMHAYPDIWFAAAYVAAMQNCPLLFNAPGVSPTVKQSANAEFLRVVIDLAEYVNARDISGVKLLQTVSPEANIVVTPDTAADIAKFWSKAELTETYRQAFLSRGKRVPKRTLAVHVRKNSLPRKTAPVSQHLDQIARHTDTVPVIISFGECLRDDEAVRDVARRMRCDKLVLDRPASLLEITACLAHCVGYLGSSFHGCLVASAFGRPSQLVVRQPHAKHTDADHVLLSSNTLVQSWLDVNPRVFDTNTVGRNAGLRTEVYTQLDHHWERVRYCLTNAARTDKREKMNEFRAHQYGAAVQPDLSLNDYLALIDPLIQENLMRLVRLSAKRQIVINDLTASPPKPKSKESWLRRLSEKLRSRM